MEAIPDPVPDPPARQRKIPAETAAITAESAPPNNPDIQSIMALPSNMTPAVKKNGNIMPNIAIVPKSKPDLIL